MQNCTLSDITAVVQHGQAAGSASSSSGNVFLEHWWLILMTVFGIVLIVFITTELIIWLLHVRLACSFYFPLMFIQLLDCSYYGGHK